MVVDSTVREWLCWKTKQKKCLDINHGLPNPLNSGLGGLFGRISFIKMWTDVQISASQYMNPKEYTVEGSNASGVRVVQYHKLQIIGKRMDSRI